MNADFPVEINETLETIENAEVICLLFPMIRHVLVVDTRTSSEVGAVAKVMPQARSLEERIRSIHQLRPEFPRPDNMAIIPWPKYIASLVNLGVAEALAKRLSAAGRSEAMRDFRGAIEQLARLEKAEMVHVITGENYHTIWSREQ